MTATPPPTTKKRDPKAIAKLIAFALVAIYLISFVASNTEEVQVSFVFFDANTSLVFALLLAGVLGVLVGWFLGALRRRRRSR